MAFLSRTTSQNSVGSSKTAQFTAAPTERGPMPLDTPHPQNSPAATNTRPTPPPRSRTSSHTLLSSNLNPQVTSRKSRFVDAGTTPGTLDRASISMPPPASHRQPTSRQQSALAMELEPAKDDNLSVGKVGRRALDGSVVVQDQDKMPDIQTLPASEPCSPLAPDSTLKLPSSSAVSDPEANRLSLTSLYSLGSAIYNGAAGSQSAPPSAASSNAGSVKSGSFDPTAAPLSPTRASIKSDLSASVTTATDPVSVTANDHTQAQCPSLALSCSA